MRILALTGMCFVLLAASAQASTLTAPRDGAKFAGGETTTFKWNWPDSQPWEGRLVFSRAADPQAPDWFDVDKIIQFTRSSNNNLIVQFDSLFKRGDWYWRVCNYPIDASDDLCHYTDKNLRGFTMTSTAIRDLTVPVAKRAVIKAIKRRASGATAVSAKNCTLNQRNVVMCVGKWHAGGRSYTAVSCKVTRNLKTSNTKVKISGVRSDRR